MTITLQDSKTYTLTPEQEKIVMEWLKPKLPTTWEECLPIGGKEYWPSCNGLISTGKIENIFDSNVSSTSEARAKSTMAHAKLGVVTDALNKGEKGDWYVFPVRGIFQVACYHNRNPNPFGNTSYEIAAHSLKHFLPLWKEWYCKP